MNLGEMRVECFRSCSESERKRLPVDSPESALLVGIELLLDHANHDLVTDESTLVHDLLGLFAEVGTLLDLLTEHVTRCEMADMELLLDVRSLCTLACREERCACQYSSRKDGAIGLNDAERMSWGSSRTSTGAKRSLETLEPIAVALSTMLPAAGPEGDKVKGLSSLSVNRALKWLAQHTTARMQALHVMGQSLVR